MNTTTKKAANSIVGKLTAGILSAAAVAAAVFAPCAVAFQAGGDAVLVIGDSLEVGSGPYLHGALPGVSVDAEKGRTSSQGVRVLAERLRSGHGVIVFPLGTNDSPSNPAGLAASLAAVRQLAGDRCIVVATLVRPPVGGVSVAGLNRVVEQFAGQTGAQVADWRSVVRSIPSLLGGDGVHATGEGYGVRATLLAEAVQNCLLGGAAGVSGIPAPRDPNARPPGPSRRAEPALLPVSAAVDAFASALTRAAAPIGAALHAAETAATKAGPEPVLGAP
jgi:lysophospholipase L1-like esterase